MGGKIGRVKKGRKGLKLEKRVKSESWEFANKMLIFVLIFKNSELPKVDLSFKSPYMFKFYLCLILS